MNQNITLENLTTNGLFSSFNEQDQAYLASCASRRSFEEGEVIFKSGRPAEQFFIIEDGRVVVEIPAMYGPSIVIQRLSDDDILGWSWLVPPYQWDFSAVAEVATRVIEFDGPRILQHCEEHPDFGYRILKAFTVLMSERLQAARRSMIDEWKPAGFA